MSSQLRWVSWYGRAVLTVCLACCAGVNRPLPVVLFFGALLISYCLGRLEQQLAAHEMSVKAQAEKGRQRDE